VSLRDPMFFILDWLVTVLQHLIDFIDLFLTLFLIVEVLQSSQVRLVEFRYASLLWQQFLRVVAK